MTISPSRGNRTSWLGFAAALVFVGLATLLPEWDRPKPDVAITCLLCGDVGGPDLILNVVLFVPVGLALAGLGTRPWRALWIGFALSLTIETIQLVLPGRSTTLRDVLCNASGAWLGALIALNVARWVAPSRATALRLAVATAATVVTVAATGWLFVYSPSEPPYYGHWSPEQKHLEPWTGRLSSARLDGISLPSWRIEDPQSMSAAIADGFVLELAGVGGAPTTDLGGILTLSDGDMREMLLVGPRGADLIVRVRRRAATFRFGAPEARFERLMLVAPEGAPFTLRIESAMAQTCAALNGTRACTARPAAGSSWVLLLADRGISATARILLNAFTLGLLAFPVGLLLRGVTPARGWVATFFVVIGVEVAARATGLAPLTLLEWIGLTAGLVAGLILNRLVTRVRALPVLTP